MYISDKYSLFAITREGFLKRMSVCSHECTMCVCAYMCGICCSALPLLHCASHQVSCGCAEALIYKSELRPPVIIECAAYTYIHCITQAV